MALRVYRLTPHVLRVSRKFVCGDIVLLLHICSESVPSKARQL